MKLRIGDLVVFNNCGRKRKGFVTALDSSWYIGNGCVEVTVKRHDLRQLICKEDIKSVTPREEVKAYWKFL